METLHADGHPLADYLEGHGSYQEDDDPLHLYDTALSPKSYDHHEDLIHEHDSHINDDDDSSLPDRRRNFAPPTKLQNPPRTRKSRLSHVHTIPREPQNPLSRLHDTCSSALNSRLRRADNEHFMEHFRYVIVASQLLNEYLDQGVTPRVPAPPSPSPDGLFGAIGTQHITMSLRGVAGSAIAAFVLAFLIHWARSSRGSTMHTGRVVIVLLAFGIVAALGYAYLRRQWLKYLRRNAVSAVSRLTTNWQALELSCSSALSLIQEVELVSRGYRLSAPLAPASRIEDNVATRRCARLRRLLYKSYAAMIPACIEAAASLKSLIDEDDLEKYFDIYDISLQDARDAFDVDSLAVFKDDPESLKSLRVLSYRAGVLRRVTLCSLMALEADGGKPDFDRWHLATATMHHLSDMTSTAAERVHQMLRDMESFNIPTTPVRATSAPISPSPARERLRAHARRVNALSTSLRALQAKMHILREETHRAVGSPSISSPTTTSFPDPSSSTDTLPPALISQYIALGADLRDLLAAWEAGHAALQTLLVLASSPSPTSFRTPLPPKPSDTPLTTPSLGDFPTASSSSASCSSDAGTDADDPSAERIYEAIALPRTRPRGPSMTLTRQERLTRLHEERDRQAALRARRDANTSMLRELESVIHLRNGSSASASAASAGRRSMSTSGSLSVAEENEYDVASERASVSTGMDAG